MNYLSFTSFSGRWKKSKPKQERDTDETEKRPEAVGEWFTGSKPPFVLSPLANVSLLRQSICGVWFLVWVFFGVFVFGCVAVKLSVCPPCGDKRRTQRCVADNPHAGTPPVRDEASVHAALPLMLSQSGQEKTTVLWLNPDRTGGCISYLV